VVNIGGEGDRASLDLSLDKSRPAGAAPKIAQVTAPQGQTPISFPAWLREPGRVPGLSAAALSSSFQLKIPFQPPNPDEEQHPPAICTERFNVAGIYGDNPSRFAVIAGKPSCTGPAGKNPCLPLGASLLRPGTRLLARL